MKWLALGLFIINLAVAVGFLSASQWSGTPSPQHAPLNANRLSLRAASNTPATVARPASTPPPALCVEWRGLEATDYVQAREQLKAMTGNHVMSFTEVPLESRQWVIFPPLPSPAALSAFAAGSFSPSIIISSARARPIRRGSIQLAPPSGTSPILTNACRK